MMDPQSTPRYPSVSTGQQASPSFSSRPALSDGPASFGASGSTPPQSDPSSIAQRPPINDSPFAWSHSTSQSATGALQLSIHSSVPGSSSGHDAGLLEGDGEDDGDEEMDEMEGVETKRSSAAGAGDGETGTRKKGREPQAIRKCSGDRPCATCKKAVIDCRYEEPTRRKPRHVLMEERVVELEALITSRGQHLPPSQLDPPTNPSAAANPSSPSTSINAPPPFGSIGRSASHSQTPPVSAISTTRSTSSSFTSNPYQQQQFAPFFPSQRNVSSPGIPLLLPTVITDVQPHSILETHLIRLVLPYTSFLAIPLHPQRFLTLLDQSTNNPLRPHPALLYILFAQAVRILENDIPLPRYPTASAGIPGFNPGMSLLSPDVDKAWLLSQVRGNSLAYMERARVELDNGIRRVDRPFDLVRAAVGITRYLYALGRFIEGWNVPVARLVISCGLHRLTGNITLPDYPSATGEYPPTEYAPRPYGSTKFYLHHHAQTALRQPVPPLRMRPLIVPPPRDEIDLAERVMTFWAAKAQDWSAGIGWGWSVGLEDEECTTEWPWGGGGVEMKPLAQINRRYGNRDLFDESSQLHSSPFADSPYVWSMKSMCLLNRANRLNDHPEASIPRLLQDGRMLPDHIPPLHEIHRAQAALERFRARLPLDLQLPPPRPRTGSSSSGDDGAYYALADPWYILLHANLLTAEMLTWREMANYDGSTYHRAIASARGLVKLVQYMQPETWVHVDMLVAINISLVARLLHKESDRLQSIGQFDASRMAAEEAELLRETLAGDFARWMPMAELHGMVVARVSQGLAEKEGEYERV